MENVAVLTVDEAVRVNAQRLGDIVNELGEQAAGDVLAAALEQLATGLSDARAAAAAGDMVELVTQAESVARLAWQVGLVSLAGVAVDVGTCAERRDQTGLGATLARMMRVGNRSLTEIWDGADLAP